MPSPLAILFSAALLLLSTSCASIEVIAPPVPTLIGNNSSPEGYALQQGRQIYLGKCTKCHRPEPIKNYTEVEWETDILPAMNKKTKLSASELASLHGYIQLVIASPKVPHS